MLEKEPIVNLGGVMEGFPVLNPEGYNPSTGEFEKAKLSVNEMFMSGETTPTQGRPSIPVSSFYTGDRYNTSLPGTDVEEMAANQQSTWNKWGNAIVKMAGTAGTTFVSGTAGLIYGTGKAIKDGKFSSLYDNEITRKMDEISKYMEDALPNYYSHAEQDADWYSPDNLLTANFWADKVLKNIGFSLGALAGGVTWSSALRATGLTNKLIRAGQALELVEATERVMTTVPRAQQFGALQSALSSLSQTYLKNPTAAILKSSDRIIASAMGTFGEASLESLHNLNDFRNNLISQYKDKYGYDPKDEDLQEINDYAEKVGNFTWGFNTALLTASNYIMLPKILGSSRKADKSLLSNILRNPEGKFIQEPTNFLTKVRGAGSLLFSGTEAIEEGSQFAIQVGTKSYFDRAYENKEDISSFFTNLYEVMGNTLGEGVDVTLSTKEGIENILIGGFSGALQQARNIVKEQGFTGTGGQKQKNTELALSALNETNVISTLKDQANYISRAINSQSLRQQAILDNNLLAEKDYEMDYLMSYILPRVKYGKIDSLYEELSQYEQQSISDQGFQELKNDGIVSENETKEQFLTRIDKIKSVAKNADSLYSQIKDKYSNYIDKEGNPIYNNNVIDRMVYAAAKIQDYDQRLPELTSDLLSAGVDVDSVFEGILLNNEPSKKPVKEAIKTIESLNSIQEDELKEKLRDSIELTLRRKLFVEEYNNLKRNPQSVEETEPDLQPSYKFTNINQEEEDLILNREYTLSKDLEASVKKVDNEDLWEVKEPKGKITTFKSKEEADKYKDKVNEELKDLRSLTVLNFNPDGTIRVQDSTGDRFNIKPSELTNYEKVISDQEKLQASKVKLDKQQSDIESASGTVPTNSPEEDEAKTESQSKKKRTEELFKSSTSESEDWNLNQKPSIIRSITFKNNIKNSPNYSKVKTILFTKNQEDQLGLSGLVDMSMEGSGVDQSLYTDINNGFVGAVFVIQEGKNLYFSDKDGNKLGKVGEKADINQVVFDIMPSTSLLWSNGETRYRTGEQEKATQESKGWLKKRESLFNSSTYELYDFSISRGIPNISYKDAQNPVSETLIPQDKISTQEGLLVIPTTGTVSFKGDLLKYPNGRPLLRYEDTLEPLQNNKFTRKQAKVIFEVMKALSESVKSQNAKDVVLDKKYTDFLQNVLYWRKSKDTSRNQIFIDTTTMELYFSGDRYDLTKVADYEKEIVTKLESVYFAINNTTLSNNFSKPFEEFYLEEDELKTRKWKNYQTFLLSSKNPEGTTRDIPVTTNIDKPTEAIPFNFKQKYITLQGLDFPVIQEVKTVQTTVKEPQKIGEYIVDGTTPNTYNLKNGPVEFTAQIENDSVSVTVSDNETIQKIANNPETLKTVKGILQKTNRLDESKSPTEIVLDYVSLQIATTLESQKPKVETKKAEIKIEPKGELKLKKFGKVKRLKDQDDIEFSSILGVGTPNKIQGLSEQQTNEFVQDITARFFQNIFGTNSSLFDPTLLTSNEIFDKIKITYQQLGFLDNNDPDVLSDSDFDKLVQRTKDFLRTFQIEFDEDNVISLNNEEKDQTLYALEPFSTNWKKSSPYTVKILLASLIETEALNQENSSSLDLPESSESNIGGYKLLNFSRGFATVLDKLANTNEPNKVVDKLLNLAKSDSNYVRLFTRLGGDLNDSSIDYGKFNDDDWRLFIQFYQVFTKQKPDAYIQYIESNETYTAPANLSTVIRQEKESWIQNMRALAKDKKSIVKYNSQTKEYEVGDVSKISIKTPKEQVDFLSKIGVEFPLEVYEKLDNKQKTKFGNSVSAIKDKLLSEKGILSLKGDTINVAGQFTTLAELLVKVTNPNQEITYFGIGEKRLQSFADNNALSVFENDFNSSKNLNELFEKRPELKDTFSTNSQIFKKGGLYFDEQGERIKEIKVAYIQGTVNKETDRETTTAQLSLADRYIQEINQNLQGRYYTLVPADSSTEWMLDLGNFVDFNGIQTGNAWNSIYSTFKGYLVDDINLAKDNRSDIKNTAPRAKELRFFKDILSEKTLSGINSLIKNNATNEEITLYIEENIGDINESIKSYIQDNVSDTINILKETNKIVNISDNSFLFKDLDSNFTSENKLKYYDLSEKTLSDIITFANVNYIINNIEQHKILFGDPYQFAIKGEQLDETKRIKSFLSPRRTTFNSPEYNTYLNQKYNKAGEIQLTEEDLGYHNHKSYSSTTVVQDVEFDTNNYNKVNEADAASWISDDSYRELKLKNGQWSKEAENWHQWQMAYTRQNIPGYKYPSKSLEKHDVELLAKPEPVFVTEVLKPIVSGVKYNSDKINLVLYKMSQMPLYYKAIEGTNLEKLYIKMWKEKIDSVVMISAAKVGAEKLHSLYNPDGSFNSEPFNNNIEVPWKAYGIQVENSYDKPKEQTRGSQLTKLSSLDVFNNGQTSEKAKNEYDRNVRILNEMHRNAYKELLNSLGIEDLDGSFKLVDNISVSQVLQQQLLAREASENTKNVVRLDENGQFRIPFEASASYIQIKDILYSMVDKALVSPKVSGSPHVQVPVTMWESSKEGRELAIKTKEGYKKITRADYNNLSSEQKKKVVLTSSTLKFYTKEEPYCEVMLPAWFKDKINKNRFKTDAELLNYLNKSSEGKEILKGIGFRIPTQALSSIEVFKVKGFLPSFMGNTVVVPSEITSKAGSDFDIDKLNLYLKSVYIDQNGDIRLIKYLGSEEATKDHFSKVFDKKTEKSLFRKSEILEAMQILSEKLDDPKNLIEKYADTLNRIIEENEDEYAAQDVLMAEIERLNDEEFQKIEKEKYVRDMYKKSLENEYYSSLEKLLTLPERFDRLIAPVDDAGLKQLSVDIDKLKGYSESSIKNRILNRNFMTNLRHAFITGKKWVGIAAVNITGHSLTQKSEIYVDPSRFNLVSDFDQKLLGDGSVALPHNQINGKPSLSSTKTADGSQYISDRLSGYATAFVDVAKDPYILKLIKNNLAIGTFMFLERIGVGKNTALFMNQPIIDEYLSYLENTGARGLYNQKNIDYIRSKFVTNEKLIKDAKIDVSSLSSNIEKYNSGKLTESENAVQQKILTEFLKYAKMADYSFKLTQATNYDTTKFRSADSLYKKNKRTEVARKTNIINSVDKILDNSFIGDLSYLLSYSSEALGEVLKLDKYDIRENAINPVLEPFALNEYLSAEKYDNIANKIITSFIDFLVQTKNGINSEINELLIYPSTYVVGNLAQMKKDYPEMRILRDIEIVGSDKQGGVFTLKLKVKAKDAYENNIYTEMMRELRDFEPTSKLYESIVKVSLLQGTTNSPISISSIIPLEDRARFITPIIDKLSTNDDFSAFSQGAFQRNNWKNNDIFKEVTPKFFSDEIVLGEDSFGNEIFNYNSPAFPGIKALNITPKDRRILLLSEKYNMFDIGNDFVKIPRIVTDNKTGDRIDILTGRNITPSMFKQKKAKGDTTLNDFFGYKKVKHSDGSPVLTFNQKGDTLYVYKLVNLYGDGIFASEYYTDNRPSVINNGTVKTSQEIPDADIIAYFAPKIQKSSVSLQENIKTMYNPQYDGKPEFNKLPTKLTTQTMTYAGIGSRETPKEIQVQMTELAKELDSKGYTLRSGGAEGADKAFEIGSKKKEIFYAKDATDKTRAIAKEIHPAPYALKSSYVWDLMARNTNQIFGKDLKSPVDFVIAWTPDGITNYTQRTIKTGGTGQAIDMASRKNIPVINLANSNWRQQLDTILSNVIFDQYINKNTDNIPPCV